MDSLQWWGIRCHNYVVLTLLLWTLLLRSTRCHDHGEDVEATVAGNKYMYFTYASVARSVATVTEPDNSTVQYHVWRAGKHRNCVINISTTVLDDVVKVRTYSHQAKTEEKAKKIREDQIIKHKHQIKVFYSV